jgi:hypothetical protein
LLRHEVEVVQQNVECQRDAEICLAVAIHVVGLRKKNPKGLSNAAASF